MLYDKKHYRRSRTYKLLYKTIQGRENVPWPTHAVNLRLLSFTELRWLLNYFTSGVPNGQGHRSG